MRLTKILLFCICFFSLCKSFGQGSQKDFKKLNTFLQQNLTQGWFPDSTHLYVGKVEILIQSGLNYKPIITSTDTTLTNKLSKFSTLKDYDYRSFIIRNKTIRLIVPVSVNSIAFKDRKNPMIKADSLHFELSKLFYKSTTVKKHEVIIYMEPVLFQVLHSSGY